ncbi:MAG: hypothetical protein WBV73_13980 [Phormidium sp.]
MIHTQSLIRRQGSRLIDRTRREINFPANSPSPLKRTEFLEII